MKVKYSSSSSSKENEFSDERDFGASDQKSRNRAGVGSCEGEDYNDPDELADGEARKDFFQADELEYDG